MTVKHSRTKNIKHDFIRQMADNSSKFLLLIDGVLIDFSFVIFHVQNNVFNIIQVTVYGDHIALFELIREKEQKDVIFTTKFSNHQKTPDSI